MLTAYLKLLNYKIIHAISRYCNVCRLVSHSGMKAPTTKNYQQQRATRMKPAQNVPGMNKTTNRLDKGRKKRQVMLLMGAFMLGMECLNTLVSQSRISALSGQVEDIQDRQDNIIALITQDETQIKNNHENLEIIKRVIEMKEEEDKWYNLGVAVNIVVEEFLNDIELTEELLGAALDKKLHRRLINDTIAKEKLLEVSKYVSMRGMQVLVDTPIQLLQLNAGFLTETVYVPELIFRNFFLTDFCDQNLLFFLCIMYQVLLFAYVLIHVYLFMFIISPSFWSDDVYPCAI
jgi:hypothetical protein